MRRLALPAVVIAAFAFAIVGATSAPAPHPLPSIALGATIVWRVEVAGIMFVALYGGIVTARLAWHGRTFTRVGSGGIEIPDVGSACSVTDSIDRLAALLADFESRLQALEDARHVLLNSKKEDLA
jgi:hypothetical protein